ncbi:major facilitator superfamily domain-containing protein [Annulohypoxylon maeteangense]|uniref:major facilitator superfamily domain-containing protein n=1 Tax=Annulohypoxylon maeteangense TaxID=1927788 RepID=UPI002007DC00|nr:major facilitator superfamily domain-containing protein [Annulohypoxylon maeteangense]KAI0888848.1 major facilitator superfamily domain-containing protein [Annulohypoxylon maeteangense]
MVTTELKATMASEKSDEPSDALQHTDLDVQAEESTPKEGVFAWVQVLGAFVLNLNTWGMMNSFGAFQTFYQLDMLSSYSSSNIAWIGSTQSFLLFLVSLAAGPLFDAGYVRWLFWSASLLVIVGMFLTSITSAYWQVFLTQALMMGLGFGCLYLPAPAIVSQHFHAKTALAMGASSTGSAIGGIIYPIAFNALQPQVGFGWATRVLAFILLATSVIPVFLMKSIAPPRPTRGLIDRTAFRDTPYLVLNLGLFFGVMGFYIIFNYVELLALERTDVSSHLSGYLLVIINAASLPGRIIPGYYADRIGSLNTQASVALAGAVLTFSMLAIRTTAALVVVIVLYGFMAGAFMGLPAASIVSFCPDKSKIGTRLGMTLAFIGFGMLVSNPIAGAILGDDEDWVGLVVWCGALLVASFISLTVSRILKVGSGLTKAI